MAKQLNQSEKPFDPFGNVYSLPDDFIAPVYGEEEEEEEEPIELEAEVEGEDSGTTSADNLSADTDIFGEFIISEKNEYDGELRSKNIPSKEDETKDEKGEGDRQTYESLKETLHGKAKDVGESAVDFTEELGYHFKDQGLAIVKGVAQAGNTINNISGLTHLYAYADEKLNEMGVGSEYSIEWNVKGTKNYDPEKPLVFITKNSENPSYKRNTALDWLQEEPETLAGQIVKPVSSFLTVLAALRFLGRPLGYTGASVQAGGWGAIAAEDALVGQLSLPADGKRLYEYFTDLIEELPIESDVGIKVAKYLRSNDEDPEYLKQIKVAADAVAIQFGLSKFGGVIVLVAQHAKRIKNSISKGEDYIDEIAGIGAREIEEYTGKSLLSEREAIDELKKFVEEQIEKNRIKKVTQGEDSINRIEGDVPATPSEKLLNKTVAVEGTDLIETLIKFHKGELKDGDRILNMNNVEDIGLVNMTHIIAGLFRKHKELGRNISRTSLVEKKALGQGIGGPRTLSGDSIEEEGLAFVEKLLGTGDKHLPGMGGLLDLDSESSKAVMDWLKKDYDTIEGMSSRLFAYKVILRDLVHDLGAKFNRTDITTTEGRDYIKEHFNFIKRYTLLMAGVRTEGARTVTMGNLKVTNRWKDHKGNLLELPEEERLTRNAFLNEQLNAEGFTPETLELLRQIFNKKSKPMEAFEWALKAINHTKRNSYDVFVEAFRSNLLSSVNVFQTAIVSGTIETFYAPLRDMIGMLGDAGIRTIKGKKSDWSMLIRSKNRMVGLYKGYWGATKAALKVLKDERNILDPMRSVVDRDKVAGSDIKGFAIQASPDTMANNATRWLGHLWNYTGKGVRLPIRVLGSIDEFLKQVNYNSWVYAKMMEDMPLAIKNGDEAGKKGWVKGQHSKYFDDQGRATNKTGLDFARQQIFQEDLITSGIDKKLQSVIKSTYMEPFVPIIRTPSNIVKRVMERSFAPFQLLRKEVRDQWNSSPEVRAKLLGDTVIAGGMLASTWDLIGSGRVTGAGPRDPGRRKLWEDAGFKPYSIRVGNEWYPYDRYAPFSAPLMMVANVYENSWEFNNRREDVGLAMLMGVLQSLGDLHFVGSFFDLMDGLDEMYQTGEISTTLLDKGILQQPIVPKYATQIGMGIAQLKGQQEEEPYRLAYKNADTFLEKLASDVALLRGGTKEGNSHYDELGGDEWNWLTGEKRYIPANWWSGYVPVEAPETYDPIFQELVRMDLHLSAPQRYIADIDLTLTPTEMTKYQQLVGTIKPTINGKRRTLYETLKLLMYSDRYDFDPKRPYPNNPGVRNWRVDKVQQIIQKFKSAAFKRLLAISPELKEEWIKKKTAQHTKVRTANQPEILESTKRGGFGDPVSGNFKEEGEFGTVLFGGLGAKP